MSAPDSLSEVRSRALPKAPLLDVLADAPIRLEGDEQLGDRQPWEGHHEGGRLMGQAQGVEQADVVGHLEADRHPGIDRHRPGPVGEVAVQAYSRGQLEAAIDLIHEYPRLGPTRDGPP